jgi:hypothetical protein
MIGEGSSYHGAGGCSDGSRGILHIATVLEYVIISTTGNAADFGESSAGNQYNGMNSGD